MIYAGLGDYNLAGIAWEGEDENPCLSLIFTTGFQAVANQSVMMKAYWYGNLSIDLLFGKDSMIPFSWEVTIEEAAKDGYKEFGVTASFSTGNAEPRLSVIGFTCSTLRLWVRSGPDAEWQETVLGSEQSGFAQSA